MIAGDSRLSQSACEAVGKALPNEVGLQCWSASRSPQSVLLPERECVLFSSHRVATGRKTDPRFIEDRAESDILFDFYPIYRRPLFFSEAFQRFRIVTDATTELLYLSLGGPDSVTENVLPSDSLTGAARLAHYYREDFMHLSNVWKYTLEYRDNGDEPDRRYRRAYAERDYRPLAPPIAQ